MKSKYENGATTSMDLQEVRPGEEIMAILLERDKGKLQGRKQM
jgi:hypothetical protein